MKKLINDFELQNNPLPSSSKPRIINWNNYQPSKGEYNSGEIMTVPDQSYTIPEIFEKFRRGINLELSRDVQYTDTDDFEEVDLRSTIKDPFDIDTDSITVRKKYMQPSKDDGVILGGELPKPQEAEKKPQEADGVKPTGDNFKSSEKVEI